MTFDFGSLMQNLIDAQSVLSTAVANGSDDVQAAATKALDALQAVQSSVHTDVVKAIAKMPTP
jgi:hypothetical protein